MNDAIAICGCMAAVSVCFLVLKSRKVVRRFRVYQHRGKLKVEAGSFYDVCFPFSKRQIQMQLVAASFCADSDGIDVTIKFDSRPKQFVSFVEGK